jgi:hypothetical protein
MAGQDREQWSDRANMADPKALQTYVAEVVPPLTGVLVVAGMAERTARQLIERSLRRSLHGGAAGGAQLPAMLRDDVLARAREPEPSLAPDGAEEHALRGLPWRERLATVAAVAFGTTVLGDGDLAHVAGTLGLPTRPTGDGSPDATSRLETAVARRTPDADPDLPDRVARADRRRRIVCGAAVLVLVVVAGAVVAWLSSDTSTAPTGVLQWVAVLDSGAGAAQLADDAADIGRVAGARVFTDRYGCYRGFPDGVPIDPDEWFLAVADVDRAVVDRLVRELRATPLVVARVDQGCPPPPPNGSGG